MMDCTPDTHILESYAHRTGMTWQIVIFEWLDNALEAKAKSILIEFGNKFVAVKDNGHGTEKLGAFGTLGSHVPHGVGPDRISRYGVGCKDGALWVGKENGTLHVRSVHRGRVRECRFDWQEISRNGWQCDDPTNVEAPPNEIGTRIAISPVIPRLPVFGKLLESIGYHYGPALREGVQILVKHRSLGTDAVPVKPWSKPALEDGVINTTVDVDGKKARVIVGVIKQGEITARRGFTYYRDWRVLIPNTAQGCGDYNPAHVCGLVELDSSWRLNTNKDGFLDSEKLFRAVEEAARPVLERAHQQGTSITNEKFTATVAGMMNAGRKDPNAKGKRRRGKVPMKPGAVEPTGTGPKHTQAENEQPGKRFPGKGRNGANSELKLTYARLGEGIVGTFHKPTTICMNLDNAAVAQAVAESNVLAALALAASVLSVEQAVDPQLKLLPDEIAAHDADVGKKFQANMAQILSGATAVDGRALLSVVKSPNSDAA